MVAEAKYPTETFEVAIDQLYEQVLNSGEEGPRSNSIAEQAAATPDSITNRLTDTSQYTGTHKVLYWNVLE